MGHHVLLFFCRLFHNKNHHISPPLTSPYHLHSFLLIMSATKCITCGKSGELCFIRTCTCDDVETHKLVLNLFSCASVLCWKCFCLDLSILKSSEANNVLQSTLWKLSRHSTKHGIRVASNVSVIEVHFVQSALWIRCVLTPTLSSASDLLLIHYHTSCLLVFAPLSLHPSHHHLIESSKLGQEEGCSVLLNLKTYTGVGNRIYCKTHVPKDKPTSLTVDGSMSLSNAKSKCASEKARR